MDGVLEIIFFYILIELLQYPLLSYSYTHINIKITCGYYGAGLIDGVQSLVVVFYFIYTLYILDGFSILESIINKFLLCL